MNVKKAERLLLLHTLCLWGFMGSVLLAVAAATELKGAFQDILVLTGLVLMLVTWLAFNVLVVLLGISAGKAWAVWLWESGLLGPVGILVAYFSARSAVQGAITAIRHTSTPEQRDRADTALNPDTPVR